MKNKNYLTLSRPEGGGAAIGLLDFKTRKTALKLVDFSSFALKIPSKAFLTK